MIYDLFLCNNCEQIRDEVKPGAATDIDIYTTANLLADQLKLKRQKAVPISATQKTHRMQSTRLAAIEKSVSADIQPLSTASSLSTDPVQTEVDQNLVELVDLKAEILRLTDLVNSLSTKLNFVHSYLQLGDDSIGSAVNFAAAGDVSPTTTNALPAGSTTEPMFSTVVKTDRKPTNFREAAVSAVYADLQQKDSCKIP